MGTNSLNVGTKYILCAGNTILSAQCSETWPLHVFFFLYDHCRGPKGPGCFQIWKEILELIYILKGEFHQLLLCPFNTIKLKLIKWTLVYLLTKNHFAAILTHYKGNEIRHSLLSLLVYFVMFVLCGVELCCACYKIFYTSAHPNQTANVASAEKWLKGLFRHEANM